MNNRLIRKPVSKSDIQHIKHIHCAGCVIKKDDDLRN